MNTNKEVFQDNFKLGIESVEPFNNPEFYQTMMAENDELYGYWYGRFLKSTGILAQIELDITARLA